MILRLYERCVPPPRVPEWRPEVILSCAISLDGKLASEFGDTRLSSWEDKVEVHRLRSEVDAILVGVNTVLADDPHLTVSEKYYRSSRHPIRVIVDSRARTPPNAKCIRYRPEVPTLIAVTSLAPAERVRALEQAGARVIVVNEGRRVDLARLLRILRNEFGVKRLMVEGGGRIIASMFEKRLIDRVRVSITPVVLGSGGRAVDMLSGAFFGTIDEAPRIEIERIELCGWNIVIHGVVRYPRA